MTLPYYLQPWYLKLRYRDYRDRLLLEIAMLLPARLIYWCLIRAGVYATTGESGRYTTPETTYWDVRDRWGKEHGIHS